MGETSKKENSTKKENTNSKKENPNSKKTQDTIVSTAETLSDTIITVLDRLAGKKTDLKLTFEDLIVDTGVFKAKLTGSVILDVIMTKEAK